MALKLVGLIRIVGGVCADLVGLRSEGVSAGAVHDNMPSLSLLAEDGECSEDDGSAGPARTHMWIISFKFTLNIDSIFECPIRTELH